MFKEIISEDFNYYRGGETSAQIKVCSNGNSLNDKTLVGVNAKATPSSVEVSDGKVKISGTVVFTAITTAGKVLEKSLKEVELKTEVESKDIRVGDEISVSLSVDGVDVTVLEESYDAQAIINVLIVYDKKLVEKQIVSGAETDVKTKEIECVTPLKKVVAEFNTEDEFVIEKPVKEVLFYDCLATVTAVESVLGAIIVEGNAIINMCIVPALSSSEAIKERREIPFRYEIACEDATTKSIVKAKASVKKCAIKVYVDQDKDGSVATTDLSLKIEAQAFQTDKKKVSCDAYCVNCSSECVFKTDKREFFKKQISFSKKVFGKSLEKAPENSRLITGYSERLEGVSVVFSDGELRAEGLMCATAVFCVDDDIISVQAKTPFSVSQTVECLAVRDVEVNVLRCNLKIRSGEIEMDGEILVTARCYDVEEIKLLTDVKKGEKDCLNDCAVSVYIPAEGDTLWDVAKRLRTSEERIMQLNPELIFPLTGEERIIIYRQKNL